MWTPALKEQSKPNSFTACGDGGRTELGGSYCSRARLPHGHDLPGEDTGDSGSVGPAAPDPCSAFLYCLRPGTAATIPAPSGAVPFWRKEEEQETSGSVESFLLIVHLLFSQHWGS